MFASLHLRQSEATDVPDAGGNSFKKFAAIPLVNPISMQFLKPQVSGSTVVSAHEPEAGGRPELTSDAGRRRSLSCVEGDSNILTALSAELRRLERVAAARETLELE
jgi:hypothetical protein